MLFYDVTTCARLYQILYSARDAADLLLRDTSLPHQRRFKSWCLFHIIAVQETLEKLEHGREPEGWQETLAGSGIGSGRVGELILKELEPRALWYQVRATTWLHEQYNAVEVYRVDAGSSETSLLRLELPERVPIASGSYKAMEVDNLLRAAARVAYAQKQFEATRVILTEVGRVLVGQMHR